jgi:hypothetical protein
LSSSLSFVEKIRCRTNLMHFLLPICGKFTRALLAHQFFQFGSFPIFQIQLICQLKLRPIFKRLIGENVVFQIISKSDTKSQTGLSPELDKTGSILVLDFPVHRLEKRHLTLEGNRLQ